MSVPAFLQWASSFVGTAIVAAFMLLRYRSLPRIAGGTTCDLLASLVEVARELGKRPWCGRWNGRTATSCAP